MSGLNGHSTFTGEQGESSRHKVMYRLAISNVTSTRDQDVQDESVTVCPFTVQRPQQQIKDRYKEGPMRRVYGKWSWLIMSWPFCGTFSQISCVKMGMEREQECPAHSWTKSVSIRTNKPVIHSHTLWKTSIHSLRITIEYISWSIPMGIQRALDL